jgi:hypothetical protein
MPPGSTGQWHALKLGWIDSLEVCITTIVGYDCGVFNASGTIAKNGSYQGSAFRPAA